MTEGNVGKGFFHCLTDVFGTSETFCPLGTAFPVWLTSTLPREAAHFYEVW